jgi:hypothetical protein
MNDPDRIREREHWQAIAEQLGLSPEPEEPSASEVERKQTHPEPQHKRTGEQAASPIERAELLEEEPSPRRGRRGRTMRTEEEAAERAEPKKPPTEESEDTAAHLAPPGEERPVPKRGRQRRSARSPARPEREASDTPSDVLSSGEIEEADQAAERPKRRSRGRGRQKKTGEIKTSPKTVKDDEQGHTPSAPDEEEETEAEDVRSLSNWNVPSWNELIASLYRPERDRG